MNFETETTLERLRSMRSEANDLYEDLERSYALQELWPNVHEHGSATAKLSGNFLSVRSMALSVKNGKEETRDFPLKTVPYIIRKHHLDLLQEQLERVHLKAFTYERQRLNW